MALPAPPDLTAIRRRITEAAGFPGGAMPYDPQYDRQASNLYGQLGSKLSGYDQQSNRLNQDYETQFANYGQAQGQDFNKLKNMLADRGTLFSGAYVDENANIGNRWQQRYGQLATGRQRGLEDLNRQRTAAMADYQTGLGDVESNYTNAAAQYLQQQAQAQAQAAQAQAQRQALAQLAQIQNSSGTQQYALMQQILDQLRSQGVM